MYTGFHRTPLIAAVIITFAALPAIAQSTWPETALPEDGRRIVTLEFENDLFAQRDGGYTNGFRLTWGDTDWELPQWLNQATDRLPVFPNSQGPPLWGLSLTQAIFTPADITEPEYPPDDRPYAGWLGIGLHMVSLAGSSRLDRLSIMAGVVGPASGARRTQKFVHEITGSDQPVGWENQLPNEASLLLAYDVAQRLGRETLNGEGLEWEFTPSVGMVTGNTITELRAGFYHRIGRNIPLDFGPPRLSHVPTGSSLFQPVDDNGWYAFWGLDGRYVVHNMFLDGSLFRETPSVETRRWVGEIFAGAAFQWGQNRISYTHVVRSREFETQDDIEPHGAISYSRFF